MQSQVSLFKRSVSDSLMQPIAILLIIPYTDIVNTSDSCIVQFRNGGIVSEIDSYTDVQPTELLLNFPTENRQMQPLLTCNITKCYCGQCNPE